MSTKRRPPRAPNEAANHASGPEGTDSPAYEVGYGKPPVSSRFKPGQSGNPRGRPKGARNVETILRDELLGPVPVLEGGKRRKVPRFVAILRRTTEKAFGGDVRALTTLIKLALQLKPADDGGSPTPDLSPEDSDLLDLLTARAGRIQSATTEGGSDA